MARNSILTKEIRSALLLLILALPAVTEGVTVTIVSDTSWSVSDKSGNAKGNAQLVCMDPAGPAACPAGTIWYGNANPAWTVNLASTPGAKWIWAPNTTATTPTSSTVDTELQFEKQFYLCD